MKRIMFVLLSLLSVCFLRAQNASLVGVWSLVSVENIGADGSKSFPYGEKPVGRLIFEKSGDYALQILKPGRPLIASNNKNTATAEETVALVQGANSHFGTFVVDEKNHTVIYHVEHAFFPNWEGKDLLSEFTLEKGVLTSRSKTTTFGGNSVVVTWQRKM